MKSYDSDTLYHVLEHMEPMGFTIYQKYLIGDYLFLFAFGGLQLLLLFSAYRWYLSKLIHCIFVILTIARGLADAIENSLLLYALQTFPSRHDNLVGFMSIITAAKLNLIKIWFTLILVGYTIKAAKKLLHK